MLIYTACFVPYRTAFLEKVQPEITQLENVIDSLYILDFLLAFVMAFEDRDKKLEVRLKQIAINYLRTWFLIDLICCIPFQHLEPDSTIITDVSLKSEGLQWNAKTNRTEMMYAQVITT
jgi:hypothetical protein